MKLKPVSLLTRGKLVKGLEMNKINYVFVKSVNRQNTSISLHKSWPSVIKCVSQLSILAIPGSYYIVRQTLSDHLTMASTKGWVTTSIMSNKILQVKRWDMRGTAEQTRVETITEYTFLILKKKLEFSVKNSELD